MFKYLLFIPIFILSQTNQFYLDHSFIFDGEKAKVDVYYGFNTSVLYENNLINDSLICTLILYDSTKTNILLNNDKRFFIQSNIEKDKIFFDKFKFESSQSQYNLKIVIQSKTKILFEQSKFLNTDYKPKQIQVTPILIGYDLRVLNANEKVDDKFNYNGLYFVPNLSHFYTLGNNALYWYFEIYNIKNELAELTIKIKNNQTGKVEKEFKKKYKRYNSYHSISGLYNVMAKFSSGEYELGFYYEGKKINSRVFNVFKEKSNKFDIEQVRKELRIENFDDEGYLLSYLLDSEKHLLYKNSGEEEQYKMIYEFWSENAKQANMTLSEVRNIMLERIEFLKSNYRVVNRKSILQTDAGSILIKYGQPFSIERVQPTGNIRGYEIWYYSNNTDMSNLIFVLGDLDGFGELKLLHTNHPRGTRYNINWKNRLINTTAGSDRFNNDKGSRDF
jgi:GWxTD domain-containing protein